jgi:hypothetical protein
MLVRPSRSHLPVWAVGLLAAGAAVWGCGGADRPTLHRAAHAAWCPSAVVRLEDGSSRSYGHGHFDARALVGLDVAAANSLASRHGCMMRVVGGDGAPDVITMDLISDRINVDVHEGLVTALDTANGDVIG